jgi:hypothetical protein
MRRPLLRPGFTAAVPCRDAAKRTSAPRTPCHRARLPTGLALGGDAAPAASRTIDPPTEGLPQTCWTYLGGIWHAIQAVIRR